MNAREAYKARTSGSLNDSCRARVEGWRVEANGEVITVFNVKTGERATARRKWAASEGRWSRRVFDYQSDRHCAKTSRTC